MASDNTLFFIPDISGFTDFVNHTEIAHSKHIITELLEVIMEKNTLRMELNEIEGDALFYSIKGSLPSTRQILEQAREMFLAFHQQLLLYDQRKICNCGACSSAVNLSLKFIVHFGESELVAIAGGKPKPFGKDVILAHKLLKNELDTKEYILLTDSLSTENLPEWFNGREGVEQVEGEEVRISYSDLNHLLDEVPPIPELKKNAKAPKPVVVEGFIDANPADVYELISNLNLRELWNKKVDRLEYDKDRVNRIGEKHLCVVDGKNIEFETVSNDFGEDTWVYGEVTKDVPIAKTMTNYFILKKVEEKTLLRIETHFKPLPIIGFLLAPMMRKAILKEFGQTIELLQKVVHTNFLSQLKSA